MTLCEFCGVVHVCTHCHDARVCGCPECRVVVHLGVHNWESSTGPCRQCAAEAKE